MKKDIYLSKSIFIRGLRCYKSLYLNKYCSELRDKISKDQLALFQFGKDIGILAQSLFKGGIEIPYDGLTISEQIKMSKAEIKKSKIIYEMAVSHKNVFIKIDISEKKGNSWNIYEVKAGSSIKDYYYDDISLQYYVLAGSGVLINKAFLVHVNKEYVGKENIDAEKLFNIVDVTKICKSKQDFVDYKILKQKDILRRKGIPNIEISSRCNKPYRCDFMDHCYGNMTEKIYEISKGD